MNVVEELAQVRNSLARIDSFLAGQASGRPLSGTPRYIMWWSSLTDKQQEAELTLKKRGYYLWEQDMFEVKDSEDTRINPRDKVAYLGDTGEELREKYPNQDWQECIVIMLLAEDKVQILPFGQGEMRVVEPHLLRVKESLLNQVRDFQTDAELIAILDEAKKQVVATTAAKPRASAAPKATAVPKAVTF